MIPRSFNLLPPRRRADLSDETLYVGIRRNSIALGIYFAVVVGVLLATQMILDQNYRRKHDQVVETQRKLSQERGESLEERIRLFNARLSKVNTMQQQYVKWTPVIAALAKALPTGVTLQNLDVDRTTKLLVIKGNAATRSDLLQFQKTLAASSEFQNPSSPVSNLLARENIDFDMTVELKTP